MLMYQGDRRGWSAKVSGDVAPQISFYKEKFVLDQRTAILISRTIPVKSLERAV